MIKKLFFLIFLNISVLTMYTNTNASELNSVKISTLTSEDASSNTKSIECRGSIVLVLLGVLFIIIIDVFIVVHIVTHLGSGNNILCY